MQHIKDKEHKKDGEVVELIPGATQKGKTM
jgi:hypothetical protein